MSTTTQPCTDRSRYITVPREDADTLRRCFKRAARRAHRAIKDSPGIDSTDRRLLKFEAARCLAAMPIPTKREVARGTGPLRLYVNDAEEAMTRLTGAIEATMQREPTARRLERIAVYADAMRSLCDGSEAAMSGASEAHARRQFGPA